MLVDALINLYHEPRLNLSPHRLSLRGTCRKISHLNCYHPWFTVLTTTMLQQYWQRRPRGNSNHQALALSKSTREPFAVWNFATETRCLCAAPKLGTPWTSERQGSHPAPAMAGTDTGGGQRHSNSPSDPILDESQLLAVKPCHHHVIQKILLGCWDVHGESHSAGND